MAGYQLEKRYWFNPTECLFDLTTRKRNRKLYLPPSDWDCENKIFQIKLQIRVEVFQALCTFSDSTRGEDCNRVGNVKGALLQKIPIFMTLIVRLPKLSSGTSRNSVCNSFWSWFCVFFTKVFSDWKIFDKRNMFLSPFQI